MYEDNIVIFHISVCVEMAMRSIRYETGTCKLIVVNNEISLITIQTSMQMDNEAARVKLV